MSRSPLRAKIAGKASLSRKAAGEILDFIAIRNLLVHMLIEVWLMAIQETISYQ